MTTWTTRLVACALAAALAAPLAAESQRSPQQQRADIIVVDRDNKPVTDLTPEAIIVREDGVAREVISVEPAGPPSPVVLLVDNSQAAEPAILDLRKGLTDFVTAISTTDSTPATPARNHTPSTAA